MLEWAVPPEAVWVVTVLLLLTGAAGAVLPLLPGAPLILAAALWLEYFLPAYLSWWTIGGLAFLTVLSLLLDLAVPAALGATKRALFGAVIGAFIGFFFGGVGAIVGAVAGAALAEKSLPMGARVGLGLAAAVAVRAVLVVFMLGVFVLAILVA